MLDHHICYHEFENVTSKNYCKKCDILLWNSRKESWWSIQDAENVTLASKKLSEPVPLTYTGLDWTF